MQENTSLKLQELRDEFDRINKIHDKVLPKVDAGLLIDLLWRERMGDREPMYTLEVFTKEGLDVEEGKKFILQRTGTMPAIYDKATHWVGTHRVNLEFLKEINDMEWVDEINGTYYGGLGTGAAAFDRKLT